MPEEKNITTDGSTVFYRVSGEGTAVFLLHGFGEDGRIWDGLPEKISNDFRFIIPDLPGSGHSPQRSGSAEMQAYAAIIEKIASTEGCEKVILIGHSLGGYISLAFAKQSPERLQALALFHSTAFADSAEKIEMRKKSIAFLRAHGAAAFLKTSIPKLFFDHEKNSRDIETLIAHAEGFSAGALCDYYEAMITRGDSSELLRNLNCPVLFIIGQHDTAVPFKESLAQSALPAESHISILRESGHMGMLEEPDKSAQILAQFLQSVR